MKKLYRLGAVCACNFLFFASSSPAALVDQGNGVILDEISGLYWYQDLDAFDYMTYSEQLTFIASLPHASSSWHMASNFEMAGLWNNYTAQEISDNFLSTLFTGVDNTEYWTGRYNSIYDGPYLPPSTPAHYAGRISVDSGGSYNKYDLTDVFFPDSESIDNLGAWVFTDTNPVPIPPATWLFVSGLLGLAGIARRKKAA